MEQQKWRCCRFWLGADLQRFSATLDFCGGVVHGGCRWFLSEKMKMVHHEASTMAAVVDVGSVNGSAASSRFPVRRWLPHGLVQGWFQW